MLSDSLGNLLLMQRSPGRPRIRSEYTDKSGYIISSPLNDSERRFPTIRKGGQILRSHLVWNRAHPDDLVLPGQEVHHRNEIKGDDRLCNLEKFPDHAAHARRHAEEGSGSWRSSERQCKFCGESFVGRTRANCCGLLSCRAKAKAAQADRTNQKLRADRAVARAARLAATAHLCAGCGVVTIHDRARFCNAPKCQRARNTEKQRRWASKPDVREHLRQYSRRRLATLAHSPE